MCVVCSVYVVVWLCAAVCEAASVHAVAYLCLFFTGITFAIFLVVFITADRAVLLGAVLHAVQWQCSGFGPLVGRTTRVRDELSDGTLRHHHRPAAGAQRVRVGVVQHGQHSPHLGYVLWYRETGTNTAVFVYLLLSGSRRSPR